MISKYPEEIYDFVKTHVEGRTNKELAEIVNKKFGTQFTEGSMKSYIGNHKLYRKTRGGYRKVYSETFPEEIAEYIKSNYKGIGPKEMAAVLNQKYGSSYSQRQLNTYYKNHVLNSGLDGRFQKGCISMNKGKKMSPEQYEKCKGTMFKKGNIPFNQMKVGECTHTTDGYLIRKVRETGTQRERFEFVHRATWEKHHGPIPEGKMVSFLDGNKDNCDIENLILIDNFENLELNRSRLRFGYAPATKVGVTIAKIKISARGKKHENQMVR